MSEKMEIPTTIKFTRGLLERCDRYWFNEGFRNRSDLVRQAVEAFISTENSNNAGVSSRALREKNIHLNRIAGMLASLQPLIATNDNALDNENVGRKLRQALHKIEKLRK